VSGNSLALQNRQPEDKGYPFPEYACHGGGESPNDPLAGKDQADPVTLFAIPTLFFLLISILTVTTGFPIWLKNNTACPIGTILVSGLPQAEDHQVGRRVIFLVALLCHGGA
jgi:hypothetical protein